MLKSITDWDGVTNVHSSSKGKNREIVSLGLGFCQAKIFKFMDMNIRDAGAEVLAQALHHNSTLEWLDLSNNSINDAGANALAQVLCHNPTLEWLNLSNNNISDTGVEALAQALYHNSTLEELLLSNNDAIGKEGTHRLLQALTVNTSITTCGV